ncbi:MAG: sigma 54-interacting transcriptional regulator [candidate division Zixibacteria bacterium]|nr:sigma 54-interacting transcriptional regulator [candidate division Zixibacteria bacterium]
MNIHEHNTQDYLQRTRVLFEGLIAKRRYDQVISFFEENSSELTGKGTRDSAMFWYFAARAYAARLDLPRALRMARQAESELSAMGETSELSRVYLTLGGILRDMGELEEAERCFRDSESIARRSDNEIGRGNALNSLAQLCFMRSDMQQAISLLMAAIGIARELGDTRRLAFLYGNLGRVQSFVGASCRAIENLNLNIKLSLDLGDKAEAAKARLSLGYERVRLGALAEAEQEFDLADEIIASEKMNREEVISLIYRGELETKRERFEPARHACAEALRLADRLAPDGDLSARARRGLAELALKEGKWRRALKLARDAEKLFSALGEKIDLGVVCQIQAEALFELEFVDEAVSQFTRCLDLLDGSSANAELARALEWAGTVSMFSLHKRLAYLFRAQEMYTRRGDARSRSRIDRFIATAPEFSTEYEAPVADITPTENLSSRVEFITANAQMKKIMAQMLMIRTGDLPILLTGETGVGKGQLARHFHALARPGKPFISVNVTNMPENLLESELFGHRKGAFTDAVENAPGLLVAANGGVLFLDEIGEMPLKLQTRLLSVIEEKRFRPLGSVDEIEVDFILITATNSDLKVMVEEGRFRRDLYHRLDGFTFDILPLRDRKEDIALLLEHYLSRYGLLQAGQSPESELMRQFLSHSWPGNVRELENMVKRMKAFSSLVKEGSLVELVQSSFDVDREVETSDLFNQVERFERGLILEALISSGWNKSGAARQLKIHESTLRAKMKRYEIHQPAA